MEGEPDQRSRKFGQSKSFSAARTQRVAFHDDDDHDCQRRPPQHQRSEGVHDLQPETSAASSPHLLRSLHSLHSFGRRRSFAQIPLKEALNITTYTFVKECSQSGNEIPLDLQSPSPKTRRHSSYDPARLLASRDSMIQPEIIDAMKKSFGGNEPVGAGSAQEILGAFASGTLPEVTNAIVTSPKLPPGMERASWSIRDYEILRSVHKGYASDVYEAKCRLTGTRVAVKAYVLENMEDIPRVQLAREIRLHSMCNHTNIVQFYAAFVEDLHDGDPGVQIESTGGRNRPQVAPQACRVVVLIVEWAGRGDLSRFIRKQGGSLTEAKAINLVLLPLLRSLHYLHSKGLVHRDLKPENLIFDDDMVLKMADFGLALDLNEERANTRAGTLDYMAPEVLLCPTKKTPADFKFEPGSRHYTTGADAWAVGAIFYELLVGSPPFRSNSTSTTARHIVNGQVVFPPHLSTAAQNFISACLHLDPTERPTVVELIEHELLLEMRERAQFRIAAMRSNSFVEFIAKQQKQEAAMEKRHELQHQGSQGAYLDSLLADEDDSDDGDRLEV